MAKLNLKLNLFELYGDKVVYSSRPSYEYNPWLQPETHQSNLLTSRELLIASPLPVIVHEATVTDKIKQLFDAVNIDMPSHYLTYETKSDYENLLKLCVKEGKQLYFQYPHGEGLVPDENYAVDRQLFLDLNNKTLLSKWTGGKYLPHREVIEKAKLESVLAQFDYPYVIKPGGEHPTAGGYGVMICYNDEDKNKSLLRIHEDNETDLFIVEDYIQADKNYCVQYASDGQTIEYIGASLQITEKYGKYRGNEIDHEVPETIIEAGRNIMQNGVDAGYKGIAGFDLLTDETGAIYAIDLNFRQNGSTSLLLLEDYLNGDYKNFLAYYSEGDNEAFFNTILEAVKHGILFPLSYYDGDYKEKNEFPSRFIGIWHGEYKTIEQFKIALEEKIKSGNKEKEAGT